MPAGTHNTPAVLCQNVQVIAGKSPILSDCSFSLPQGSVTGVIGPNGAGKSTLLGLCNGFVLPATGTVHCLGERLTSRNALHLRKRIGYVAQWRVIDPRQPITVHESVLCGTFGKVGLFNRPKEAEHRLAEKALEMVGVQHLSARPLGLLSGGEAQRVAIARALAQEPELLLLDEPTASLDWQARREVLEVLHTLCASHSLTILIVTHELNAVYDLCDQTLFLKKGRIVWQGPVGQALDSERLSNLYDTPVSILHNQGKPVVLV